MEPSGSTKEAVDRLARAVDRYLGTEAESRASADRLVGALEVIPQGVVLADETGTVVFRNPAAARFQSARHGEALVEAAILELIAAAVGGTAESRTVDLFGPPRQALQLRSVPLAAAVGPSRGAFLIVEDVTERHHLEAVRRDFVANISHELKTPVGALGVLAEALADEHDSEVIERLVGRMQQEAFRVAQTIDDLLQLSQIEGTEQPIEGVVPLGPVVSEAVERSRSSAEVRGIDLVVLGPADGVAVAGDRRQLVSAVANLCENAVKYSDPGDEVSVSARVDDGWAEISVADQGIGIPAADVERIFERFYRVDPARSRDTGGTGLGLSLVRHVVANHGGTVTVRSREGEGSTFTVRLPLAGTRTSTPSPSSTRSPS